MNQPVIVYLPNFCLGFLDWEVPDLIEAVDWLDRTEARAECFMAEKPTSYTYGQGRGVRTYESTEMLPEIRRVMRDVNDYLADDCGWGPMNGCFLNLYRDQRQALGWHADDFRKMDHERPVAVVSLGEPREIWWRPNGQKGVVPESQRQKLAHGSLFIMPPGFQHTHQHRIPKGDREMGARVSLTFRAFLDEEPAA